MNINNFSAQINTFSRYGNIQTVGEEYPDVPFTTTATPTVSVAAVASNTNQAFSGSPR